MRGLLIHGGDRSFSFALVSDSEIRASFGIGTSDSLVSDQGFLVRPSFRFAMWFSRLLIRDVVSDLVADSLNS